MKIAKAWLFAVLLAATAFACGGDDDDDDTPDAAPTPDASALPDSAPPIDADTTPDAVPPGEMTLTVIDGKAGPVQDVDVVFSNRDGTLISHMKTDVNGEATETVPGRAFVSVFATVSGGTVTGYRTYTLGGVMPGDAITIDLSQITGLGLGNDGDIGTLAGTVTVDWPGAHTTATRYDVTDGCESVSEDDPGDGSDPPDTTAEVYTGCRVGGADSWHIVATAFMAAGMFGGETLAASYAKNVSASDTVTLGAWNTNFEGPSVTVGNPPKGGLAVIGDGSFTLDGVTYDFEDGDFFFGGSGTYQALVPEGFGPDSTIANTLVIYGAGMNISGLTAIQASQAGLGSDLTYDLAVDALPGATDGTMITGVRPSLSWFEAGDLSVANIAQINFNWDVAATETHRWLVVTDPGDATPFQLPELPTALQDYAPAGDTNYNNVQALYIEADYITDDWDTIRENGGAINQGPADANFVLRFALPILEESAPLRELPNLSKRIRTQILGR